MAGEHEHTSYKRSEGMKEDNIQSHPKSLCGCIRKIVIPSDIRYYLKSITAKDRKRRKILSKAISNTFLFHSRTRKKEKHINQGANQQTNISINTNKDDF